MGEKTTKGNNALNMACQNGDQEMVELLLKHKADPDGTRTVRDITGRNQFTISLNCNILMFTCDYDQY